MITHVALGRNSISTEKKSRKIALWEAKNIFSQMNHFKILALQSLNI